MSYTKHYYPKSPVKSFQDLEVYQLTHNLAVKVVKRAIPAEDNEPITTELVKTALSIPRLIATAHSLRFGDSELAVETLEKTLLNCNLVVVYLEQYRDLVNRPDTEIEHAFFEEQIKEYLKVRGKILRLQKSWLKFMKGDND